MLTVLSDWILSFSFSGQREPTSLQCSCSLSWLDGGGEVRCLHVVRSAAVTLLYDLKRVSQSYCAFACLPAPPAFRSRYATPWLFVLLWNGLVSVCRLCGNQSTDMYV